MARRLGTRHRFAALGLAGMLMVATPWVEVLREKALQVEAALGAQTALDPLGQAVAVQRALLAHRLPARRVLMGEAEVEAERAARQHDVDQRIEALNDTLQRGRFVPAVDEGVALADDWRALVANIAQRVVDAQQSDRAHQLLVEQTLQVIDLVARTHDLHDVARVAAAGPGALHVLPALEAAIADVEHARHANGGHDLESAIAKAVIALRQAARAPAAPADANDAGEGPRTTPPGMHALTAYLEQARTLPSVGNDNFESIQASLMAWSDAERTRLARAVTAEATRRAAHRRGWLVGALAATAFWLGLLWATWPRRTPQGATSDRRPANPAGQVSESRGPTERLLRRLRDHAVDTEQPPLR